jgi:hypothetical protein
MNIVLRIASLPYIQDNTQLATLPYSGFYPTRKFK